MKWNERGLRPIRQADVSITVWDWGERWLDRRARSEGYLDCSLDCDLVYGSASRVQGEKEKEAFRRRPHRYRIREPSC